MATNPIQLFTIGFTQKSAEQFFGLLAAHGVNVLVDIRLHPDSQLSGFAKGRDLPYFLRTLINCDYVYQELMCPTEELLKQYRSDSDWARYEAIFNALLTERDLIKHLDRGWWESHRACLLCSEHTAEHCHRRLVLEYLAEKWSDLVAVHL